MNGEAVIDELSKPIQELGIPWNERWLIKFYESIERWMTWEVLLQTLVVLLALCVGWLVKRSLSRWSDKMRTQRVKPLSYWMALGMTGAVRLAASVSALLILVVYTAVANALSLQYFVVDGAISLLVAWVIIRLVTGFISSETISRAVALVIWVMAALNMFGLLEKTRTVMEAMSFKMGTTTISMFTVTRAVLILVVFLWIANLLVRLGEKMIGHSSKSLTVATRDLFSKMLKIVFFTLAVLISLQMAGIDLTAFAVVMGALGVGIGFGLQKITSNFISGIILMFERTITKNDVIEVGGVMGTVRYIGVRHTMIETVDGREILVPNEDFIAQRVTNYTYTNAKARVQFTVGVDYASDLETVTRVILEVVKAHPRCIEEPPAACFVREFAASSVDMLVIFWVKDVRDGTFGPQHDIMVALHKRFKQEGIEIPYPTQRMVEDSPGARPAPVRRRVVAKKPVSVRKTK